MSDFRSDPMPSAEGRGKARAAWDAYIGLNSKIVQPVLDSAPVHNALKSASAGTVSDLVGFWVLWHLHGGFEGLRELGMSRSSIFRKIAAFRKLFGTHPDEFELTGVTLDVKAYARVSYGRESGSNR